MFLSLNSSIKTQFLLCIGALAITSGASAELSCEVKHQTAIANLTTEVQTMKYPKLESIILSGKSSGISLMGLSSDEKEKMKATAGRHLGKFRTLLAEPGCVSQNKKIEDMKKAFSKNDGVQSAVIKLYLAGGLNGLNLELASLATPPKKQPYDNSYDICLRYLTGRYCAKNIIITTEDGRTYNGQRVTFPNGKIAQYNYQYIKRSSFLHSTDNRSDWDHGSGRNLR